MKFAIDSGLGKQVIGCYDHEVTEEEEFQISYSNA